MEFLRLEGRVAGIVKVWPTALGRKVLSKWNMGGNWEGKRRRDIYFFLSLMSFFRQGYTLGGNRSRSNYVRNKPHNYCFPSLMGDMLISILSISCHT